MSDTEAESIGCETCNGSLQIWDRGWKACPDCREEWYDGE